MPEVWTITGEAGKAVDATARTLPQMSAEGCTVEFASLAEDRMTWDVWLDRVDDATGILPEVGQTITLWRDSTRFFHGHVTGKVPYFSAGRMGYSITVSGPWYFLANTSISSVVPDQTTTESERAVYLFDTGSPRDHLISLVSRAIELGLPISMGSMATVFDVPRLSLREMSFAEAISEIMRWVADGLVYFDYSGAGHPALCMQRRATATTITLDPTILATQNLSLKPRHDLQIEELKLYYARRTTVNGHRLTAYELQSAGSASGPLPSRQIITSTGPEMDTYVPMDLTDSVEVQSEPFEIGKAMSLRHDILRSAQATVSVATAQFEDVWSSGGSGALSGGGFSTTYHWPENILQKITDRDGNDIDLNVWKYMLTKGETRNWWEKDGIEFIEARVTASVYEAALNASDDWIPEWAKLMGAQRHGHPFNGGNYRTWYEVTVSTTVTLVKTLWSAPTTLIRTEDWGWFNPPAGLAANLLSTQDWLPYEGTIPAATDEIPAGNAVGCALNFSGWVPETATMRALISGYTVRPATGQITYHLGPPARHAYRDLVNRFRQSGADNIYWVSGGAGDITLFPPEDGLPSTAIVFTGLALEYSGSTLTFTV